MRFPLYITYDDKKIRDGFGAQGLRIVGIFAVAKFFRLRYLHQGISEIGDKVELVGVTGDDSKYSSVLRDMNRYISFPSSHAARLSDTNIEIEIHNLGFRILFQYILLSLIKPNRYVLKVCLPFGVVDRIPWIYALCRSNIPNDALGPNQISSDSFNVVHIRASEHSPDKTRPQLNPDYYDRLLFYGKHKLNPDARWIVHTDFYKDDFLSTNRSERVVKFRSLISKLDQGNNFDVYHYAEIENVFRDMLKADNLIISRSALSYLAGILCKGKVIYPSNHGHAKLPGWIKETSE